MQFNSVTCNLKASAVRHEQLEGRDCFVVPMAMLAEGVHNGSNGALYYPGDELGKDPQSWNHIPIVVYHPTANGQSVSARTPEVLNSRKVGVVLNSKYDTKLRSEAWLFKDRIDAIDARIKNCIENEQAMEVSTGLYTDNEVVAGTWNGEAYTAIARNHKPDHLALLPDQEGAYSVKDGGGLFSVNAAKDAGVLPEVAQRVVNEYLAAYTANSLSHGAIRDQLYTLIRQARADKDVDCWIEDVYDDHFVYSCNGGYRMQEYTNEKDHVKLTGNAIEVARTISWTPLGELSMNATKTANSGTDCPPGKKGKKKMFKKDEMVGNLISDAATQWEESDREYLMGLDDAILSKLAPVANSANQTPAGKQDANAAAKTSAGEMTDAIATATSGTVANGAVTLQDYVDAAPNEIRELLTNGLQVLAAEKASLVAQIKANEANSFTDLEFEAMSVNEVRRIARLAAPTKATQVGSRDPLASYVGNAGAVPSQSNVKVEGLKLPSLV